MVSHPRAAIRIDRLRTLNEPVRVEVQTDEWGRLLTIVDVRQSSEMKIDSIIDSWRIDDEWWRNPISRRYLDIVLAGGKHVVLFQDLVSGEWYLQKP